MGSGFDFTDVNRRLANDLRAAGDDVKPESRKVAAGYGYYTSRRARNNAQSTALPHGKHYPRTIGYDGPTWTGRGWRVEVGPDTALPQGGMSFETGSINSPPHWDIHRAADIEEPKTFKAAEDLALKILADHL